MGAPVGNVDGEAVLLDVALPVGVIVRDSHLDTEGEEDVEWDG